MIGTKRDFWLLQKKTTMTAMHYLRVHLFRLKLWIEKMTFFIRSTLQFTLFSLVIWVVNICCLWTVNVFLWIHCACLLVIQPEPSLCAHFSLSLLLLFCLSHSGYNFAKHDGHRRRHYHFTYICKPLSSKCAIQSICVQVHSLPNRHVLVFVCFILINCFDVNFQVKELMLYGCYSPFLWVNEK